MEEAATAGRNHQVNVFFVHKLGKPSSLPNVLGSTVEVGVVGYFSPDGTRKGIVHGDRTKHMGNLFQIQHLINKFQHNGQVANKTEINGGILVRPYPCQSRSLDDTSDLFRGLTHTVILSDDWLLSLGSGSGPGGTSQNGACRRFTS